MSDGYLEFLYVLTLFTFACVFTKVKQKVIFFLNYMQKLYCTEMCVAWDTDRNTDSRAQKQKIIGQDIK